jgi:hypothetical protein
MSPGHVPDVYERQRCDPGLETRVYLVDFRASGA